jgi:1,4-dihydroxy-2-naphthoate octaprenyltransferase
MPALLKGFIDRIFVSGFAFVETEGGTGYEPLLRGKTAQIITTMDTPKFVYHFIYHAPGHNALGVATLKFSGFKVKKPLRFGLVRYSDEDRRKKWIARAYQQGLELKGGVFSPFAKLRMEIIEWLKAIRFQFYPMTFIAYSVGALGMGGSINKLNFWLGYGFLFFTEVVTVFSNEYYDQRSDQRNEFYGPFNGGSRVLVNQEIGQKKMEKAILVATTLSFAFLVSLMLQPTLNGLAPVLSSLGLFFIATGYTVPPLKLSYKTFGELTVGFTHSFAVIALGYLYQGGSLGDNYPWLVGLPLFLSVLPSITLAAIPDYEADKIAQKKTIAVRLGARAAAGVALFFTIATAITAVLFDVLNIYPDVFRNILFGVIPHGILLSWMLIRYIRKYEKPGRIDLLIVAALTYLMWFAVVPLVNLLN